MKIAGIRGKSPEAYPRAVAAAAAAGLFVRIGFDNSTAGVSYNIASEPVVKEPEGATLSVPLTGFTPGNLILGGIIISAQNNVASAPTGAIAQLTPQVDVGAGPRIVTPVGQPRLVAGFNVSEQEAPAFAHMFAVKPVAVEVTAAPVITYLIDSTGPDTIFLYEGVFLWAAELNATTGDLITQLPTTILTP